MQGIGYVPDPDKYYNIETSVTGLVIILILAVVVLFAVEWVLRRISVRARIPAAGLSVVNAKSRPPKQTEQALLKLAEVTTNRLRKLMSKNADHAEQPVVNYLLAAEAAQQRGDEARANQHLERASELASNDQIG